MPYFLGGDLGGTKTHIVIADEAGHVLGFGESGPGNHEGVGYDGLTRVVADASSQASAAAGIPLVDIAGAGFGIGGYDWPDERADHLRAIAAGGVLAPVEIVNDVTLGLVAGAEHGWGVAVVSGTGCNCRGWDASHQHEGRVTGYGIRMGEGAGASELMDKTAQALSHMWTKRGPETALLPRMLSYTGAPNLDALIEGYTIGRYRMDSRAAPIIFDVAREGDAVAQGLVRWAGTELGEMVCAVCRQLGFENLEFDVVMIGGMFQSGEMLIAPMREVIHATAPKARLVRLTAPPVMGAVLLGMQAGGLMPTPEIRKTLLASLELHRASAK